MTKIHLEYQKQWKFYAKMMMDVEIVDLKVKGIPSLGERQVSSSEITPTMSKSKRIQRKDLWRMVAKPRPFETVEGMLLQNIG